MVGMEQTSPPTNPGPPPTASGPPTKDECNMAMLAHLLAIVTGFIGPLIIWLIKKDQSPFVDDQGKEALNFQITMLFGWLAIMVVGCLTLGLGMIFGPVLFVVAIVFCIMAAMAANKGVAYRYPFAVRLIK